MQGHRKTNLVRRSCHAGSAIDVTDTEVAGIGERIGERASLEKVAGLLLLLWLLLLPVLLAMARALDALMKSWQTKKLRRMHQQLGAEDLYLLSSAKTRPLFLITGGQIRRSTSACCPHSSSHAVDDSTWGDCKRKTGTEREVYSGSLDCE